MALSNSNPGSSLARYRPAIIAITAIAAGCTVYYIHSIIANSGSTTAHSSRQQNTLHRSNARRRGRQPRMLDLSTSATATAVPGATDSRPPADGVHDGQDPLQPPQVEANGNESQTLAAFGGRIPVNQRRETTVDAESEHSWRGDADAEEINKDGQSLLNLLYRIAEEQARKEGYVHRGVTCNSCSALPIRGIRYRCANCVDFDLCEQCEALQIHPKTHLFYKVRVPAPFIGNPRQPQPVWYPGKPTSVVQNLSMETSQKLCKETGFQVAEIEALWEQFRCLAATEWQEDPNHYHLAIDRQTFDKCFIPSTSIRPPPPNLIYDRLFAFYDTNTDGLIGFDEFITGLASLTKNNLDERRKRIFNGYDVNQDGYVDRKDFLRMFRANYALTKELLREVISSMDDEMFDWSGGARDIVVSSQPISSAFSGAIQPGEQSRTGEGKVEDENGDLVISDNIGPVREEGTDSGDHNESLADRAESAVFGDVGEHVAINLRNCRSMVNEDIANITWPPDPDFLIFDDGCKALNKPLDWFCSTGQSSVLTWKVVTDLGDRRKILLQALHRLESFVSKQQSVRQDGIYERWRRRQFFLDDENGAIPPDGFERQERSSPSNGKRRADDPSFARVAALDAVLKADFADEFRTSVVMELQNLGWRCFEDYDSASEFSQILFDMIFQGWSGDMVAEGIADTAPDFPAAMKLVSLLFSHIKDAERRVTSESPFESMPQSRRSRSSSKVRFQDDLAADDEHEVRSTTSMSSRSIPIGERWGGYEIPEAEKDVGREVLYQVTQEAFNELLDPIFKMREELAIRAMRTRPEREAYRRQLGILDTPINQSHIKEIIDVFQKKWYNSAQDPSKDKRINEEDLTVGFRIKATGEVIEIQQSLEKLYKTRKEARKVTAEIMLRQKMKELDPDVEAKRETAVLGQQRELSPQNNRNHQPSSNTEEATTPFIIHTTTYDPDAPPPSTEPEAVLDLHEALIAFHGGDSLLEKAITQKHLEELLAVSGYAPISSSPSSPSASTQHHNSSIDPPDPTLPQNRPDTTTTPATAATPDATLPHNRPTATAASNSSSSTTTPPLSTPNPNPTPTTNKPNTRSTSPPPRPTIDRLKHLLAMSYVEAEDERRGGPGRISFEEFEMVMRGEKGAGLGFVGDWVDKAMF